MTPAQRESASALERLGLLAVRELREAKQALARELAEHDLTKAALDLACKDLDVERVRADQARVELAQFKERALVMSGAVWEGTRVDHVRMWFHELAGVSEAEVRGLTGQEWAAKCKATAEPKPAPRRHVYVAGGQCCVRCGAWLATAGRTLCEGPR